MLNDNAADLKQALEWLDRLITNCLNVYFKEADEFSPSIVQLAQNSWLAQFVDDNRLNYAEFAILMLAIAPHLNPQFFNQIFSTFIPEGGDFPEFGGVKGTQHRGILPTGETAQFILAGSDLKKRMEVQHILSNEHWFFKKHLIWLEAVREGEPLMSGRLILNSEIIERLTVGTISKPRFSSEFPAEHIETKMDWDDLVLSPSTLRQIHEIEKWIEHHEILMHDWGMRKKIKPGYRALFFGSPGTGKTLTATLLGKQSGKEVFRIDLSRVVSKFIGETEKNLSKLFDKAEDKNWILFFDEADALFGKRTEISDAHDKYANQEVAYLLQRIEGYNGLVILASNQRANIDDAFVRRFQTIIHFPMPRPEERLAIWKKSFPAQIEISPEINWQNIAARYELSGAVILNVVQYCAIELLASDSNLLELSLLESAIQREFIKEGKII